MPNARMRARIRRCSPGREQTWASGKPYTVLEKLHAQLNNASHVYSSDPWQNSKTLPSLMVSL